MLRLQAGMVRDSLLAVGCASARNRVEQWLVFRHASETACFPPAEVLRHSLRLDGFSEKHPRFARPLRGDADFGELLFSVLRAVATPKTEIKAHQCGTHLVAGLCHRVLDEVLENRMSGHTDVSPRYQHGRQQSPPFDE